MDSLEKTNQPIIGEEKSDCKKLEGLIARQLDFMYNRFTTLEQRFDHVDQRFTSVNKNFDIMSQRLDTVNQSIDTFQRATDRGFDAVGQKLDTIDQRVNSAYHIFTGIDLPFGMMMAAIISFFILLITIVAKR